MRHDKVNGKRFAEEVHAEFKGVKIKAAKK